LIQLGNDESPCRGGVLTTRCILELLGDKVYERLPFLWDLTGAVIITIAKEFEEKQILNQEVLNRALHAIRLTVQPLHPALHESYLDPLLRVSVFIMSLLIYHSICYYYCRQIWIKKYSPSVLRQLFVPTRYDL
jgi:hypothetical protein